MVCINLLPSPALTCGAVVGGIHIRLCPPSFGLHVGIVDGGGGVSVDVSSFFTADDDGFSTMTNLVRFFTVGNAAARVASLFSCVVFSEPILAISA